MMRSIVALILAAVILVACSRHPKPLSVVEVRVEASSYLVAGAPFDSLEGVVAALRADPKLESLHVFGAINVSGDRVEATVRAIRAAGIDAPFVEGATDFVPR
jgi:hypothetical protein